MATSPQILPPPLPPSYTTPPSAPKPPMSYGVKLLLIALIGGVLMIASFIVWGFTESRGSRGDRTAREIAEAWGPGFSLEKVGLVADSAVMQPAVLRCKASVESQRMHRSIYEAEVYEAAIDVSGDISPVVDRDSCLTFFVGTDPVSDVRDIEPLSIGGRQYEWREVADGFSTELPPGTSGTFRFTLHAKGSETLRILQWGLKNSITIEGDGQNPSFGSEVTEEVIAYDEYDADKYMNEPVYPLPLKRQVTKEQFSGSWSLERPADRPCYAKVNFLLGVDRYLKVERSLKYAFLFIFFTFLSVFFAERITRWPIPLLNYILIGLALILFYVLLLSLCEHISFGAAYTIASGMTVVLISAYMLGMLHSRKVASTIFCILCIQYAACYVMLCLSAYSLLMGSLMLFCALALCMYVSLKIK